MFKNKDFRRINKKYNRESIFWLLSNDNSSGKLMEQGITDRDSYYTALLKNYYRLTVVRNFLKELHKWFFFWLIVAIFILLFIFLVYYINQILGYSYCKPNEYTLSLVTAFISLVSTVITIPIVITKYLFNNKEDDNITNIISKTQKHDTIELQMLKSRFLPSSNTNENIFPDLEESNNDNTNKDTDDMNSKDFSEELQYIEDKIFDGNSNSNK